MKSLLFISVLLVLGVMASAQSMWKALPKPTKEQVATQKFNARVGIVDTLTPGTDYLGFRFTGPTILYAFKPNDISNSSTLYTFVGIDYEHDTWVPDKNKFFEDWAVGLHFGAGGQFAPASVSGVTAAALTFSFQKIGSFTIPFKMTLGAIYNFSNKEVQAGVGPGIPLTN